MAHYDMMAKLMAHQKAYGTYAELMAHFGWTCCLWHISSLTDYYVP